MMKSTVALEIATVVAMATTMKIAIAMKTVMTFTLLCKSHWYTEW